MASKDKQDYLLDIIKQLRDLNKESIIRTRYLGSETSNDLETLLSNLKEDFELYEKYVRNAPDDDVYNVGSHLNAVWGGLHALTTHQDGNEYASAVANSIEQLREDYRKSVEHQARFLSFRQKDESESTRAAMKLLMREMTAQLDEIKRMKREIAADISIKGAKIKFGRMQDRLDKRSTLWLWISGVSVGALIIVAGVFISQIINLDSNELGPAIYFTSIRISFLGVLWTVVHFCLRMYRAHVHMSSHNLHRQNLADNIQQFMGTVSHDRQKDIIMHCLIQEVANFGSSGLINDKGDSGTPSKTIIDHFTPFKGEGV